MSFLETVWHAPGRAWAGALKAAPITLWWRFGAVMIVTGIVGGLILIFWKGPWSAAVERARLDWLGWNSMAGWFVIVICIVALMDFRLNFRASRAGVEANMAGDHDDAPPLAQVTTTTTVTGAPAAPPADTGELPPEQRVQP